MVAEKSVFDLKRDDIEAYVDFMVEPDSAWLSNSVQWRYKDEQGIRRLNTNWRPFINKENIASYARDWYQKNKETVAKNTRKYREKNKSAYEFCNTNSSPLSRAVLSTCLADVRWSRRVIVPDEAHLLTSAGRVHDSLFESAGQS